MMDLQCRVDVRGLLLKHARHPRDPAVKALAAMIAAGLEAHGPDRLPLPGLGAEASALMFARCFPGALHALALNPGAARPRSEPRFDEVEDVASLLAGHVTPGRDPVFAAWLAQALALACLGCDHLWQDLRLDARSELSALIDDWFEPLARRNVQNMKWKKFFYKQLCEREQLLICKSPTCQSCSDYPVCFGPEE